MDRARVNTVKSGRGNSFGSFEIIYPQNLHGVIEPLEFETTIKTLNSKCHSVFANKYFLILLISLLGLILTIVGFAKTANDTTTSFDNENVDPSISGGIVLVVIGFILMFIGCCVLGIVYMVFKNKVLNKIKAELETINLHFGTRRISWSLKSEIVRNYIPDHEYRLHSNNKAYRNGVKHDYQGNPYREDTVHYIEIQFPALSGQVNSFQPQVVNPNFAGYSGQVPGAHISQMNIHSNAGYGGQVSGAHISLEMNPHSNNRF
ncbi:hypothetical protein RB653_010343 [Dictyostelium firmibasis]|uniref:Uncharacterized protein n=1 Tax=Dictyostelium firmibasis TaxID=79012 RepID=A0AAN7TJX8_9MYCE